eukprot:6185392-Pleurochrysis_carterae.AAC.1
MRRALRAATQTHNGPSTPHFTTHKQGARLSQHTASARAEARRRPHVEGPSKRAANIVGLSYERTEVLPVKGSGPRKPRRRSVVRGRTKSPGEGPHAATAQSRERVRNCGAHMEIR